MAPSTPPQPHTTTASAPLFPDLLPPPNPHLYYSPPPQSRLPSNPNPNYPQLAPRPHPPENAHLLYPVASSGRGFVPLPPARNSLRQPFIFPYMDQAQGNPGFVRQNQVPHVLLGNASGAGVVPGVDRVIKGIPLPPSQHPKVGAPTSDNNIYKDLRDAKKDATLVTIRDRKVRISDKDSLYALCRSWLKNGFSEEVQPKYLGISTTRSLPRPLPVAEQAEDLQDKTEKDKEEEDEDIDSFTKLSEKDILQRHINRAKRVRARLKEERLQRISRYKTRLCLLFKNGSPPAN